MKDREGKVKRAIEELFSKPIMVAIDDMDKLEQKEVKKIRPTKSTWYDWLIKVNQLYSWACKESVGGFKDKIVSFFIQTHLNKLYMGEERN